MTRRLDLTATPTPTGTVTPPIGPVPPDTAAALEAAIRTFGVCAYSPSEPSDPYGIAGAHIWIEIEDYAAPLKAAITAHVAAEVARALEAAPDVDLAIVRTVTAAHDHGVAAARIGHPASGPAKHTQRAADAKREEADLRAAIAADKAALDATWRAHDLERDAEVAQAQAATHEACAALQAICAALHVTPPTGSTYCAEAVAMVLERVAADKARAVEGMRPVLSQADAAKLIDAYGVDAALHGALGATGDARAALLAALTGADAHKPTQCGAVDMLRGTICPTCGAREEFVPGAPTGELRRQMDAAAVEMCADCAALTGAGGGR